MFGPDYVGFSGLKRLPLIHFHSFNAHLGHQMITLDSATSATEAGKYRSVLVPNECCIVRFVSNLLLCLVKVVSMWMTEHFRRLDQIH